MPMTVLYARPDGTFVIEHNGMPYHVLKSDPLYQEAAAAAAQAGQLPPEPLPQPDVVVPTPLHPEYPNNAAALAAGLTPGAYYVNAMGVQQVRPADGD